MSDQIRMSPDQMRARAAEYDAEAAKVNEVICKMDQLLAALQSEWEGAASRAYADRYAELKPSFIRAEELIGEIAASLRSTSNNMEEMDIRIADQYRK